MVAIKYCSYLSCKSAGPDVNFFMFPKDVEITEKVIQSMNMKTDIFAIQNLYQKLSLEAMGVVLSQHPDLLGELENHGGSRSSCQANLLKEIIALYLTMKLKHLGKLRNQQKLKLIRHKNAKNTIFMHE